MTRFDYVSNSANGHEAQDLLQNILWELRRKGDLSIVVKTYRAGDPNAKNAEQFYAPFMIQFNNGARWIIFSTTSCRTDRIKGQQWDADNLKRLDTRIEKAVLTYPDDTPSNEIRSFQKQRRKYETGLEITRLDDIVSHEDLVLQIMQRSLDIYQEKEEQERAIEEARLAEEEAARMAAEAESARRAADEAAIREIEQAAATPAFEQGVAAANEAEEGRSYDFNGRAFERDVAEMLNNQTYLAMMKDGEAVGSDRKYGCFVKMVTAFGLNPQQVSKIEATAEKEEIGLLPSGGQPKTDVWAKFILTTGEKKEYTISCKRTTKDMVSVHQYTADTFADVLDPNNKPLRELLNLFQFYANARDMLEADRVALQSALRPLLPKLCKWVLGGFGAESASPIQYANFLVVYNPVDEYFAVHSVEDYTQKLLTRPALAFGTPFGWTYASKQRQKSIQLKLPIIRN